LTGKIAFKALPCFLFCLMVDIRDFICGFRSKQQALFQPVKARQHDGFHLVLEFIRTHPNPIFFQIMHFPAHISQDFSDIVAFFVEFFRHRP
jgi:hypothetical protein